MNRLSRAVALLVALAARTAHGEDLAALLAAATSAARPTATVRGDGEMVTTSPDGSTRQRVAVLQRANGDLAIAVQPGDVRALLPAAGPALIAADGGDAEPFAADAPLAGSELTREDLQPFDAARFGSPTIVDRGSAGTTVQLDPKDSQYTLMVITFAPTTHAPVKVMAYKDTLSNLLRMRRERGHVEVAGRWLPTEVISENFPLKVTTTLTLQWKPAPEQPQWFDAKAFTTASPLITE
jgi:hypothetical protein